MDIDRMVSLYRALADVPPNSVDASWLRDRIGSLYDTKPEPKRARPLKGVAFKAAALKDAGFSDDVIAKGL